MQHKTLCYHSMHKTYQPQFNKVGSDATSHLIYQPCVYVTWIKREILPWSQDQIKSVWTHTHKKMVLKIFNYFFINFLLIIKKYFFMCV